MFESLRPTPDLYWLYIIIIYAVALITITVLRKIMGLFLKSRATYLKVDPTRYSFLKNAISFLVFLTATIIIFYMIPSLRRLGDTFFASAGILAAVVGFASQQALSNVIGGVFIVLFKPFRVGDLIELGTDKRGFVEDITLRHTVITDLENNRIIIPNATINSETIINNNISDDNTRRQIEIGIAYDADIDKAIQIIKEEADKHPYSIDGRNAMQVKSDFPVYDVKLVRFGDSSLVLRAYVWCRGPIRAFDMHCDLNMSIKKRFDEEGIEIPFPYRTIVYKDQTSPQKV